MNRDEILVRLREKETALRARGVKHVALFGSCARGDNRPDSNIDIMVEFDSAAHVTVFNYAGLKDYIASLFDGPVDVVNRDGLKPYIRPAATADAILLSNAATAALRDITHHIDLATHFTVGFKEYSEFDQQSDSCMKLHEIVRQMTKRFNSIIHSDPQGLGTNV